MKGSDLPALEAGCFQAHFRRTGGSWSRDFGRATWGRVGAGVLTNFMDAEEVLKGSDRFPALVAEANFWEYAVKETMVWTHGSPSNLQRLILQRNIALQVFVPAKDLRKSL